MPAVPQWFYGAVLLCLVAGVRVEAQAPPDEQQPPAKPAAASATMPAAPSTPETKPLKPEELEQLVAPVALYPDSLLAQVLMASTYPLEVVQAERWVKQNAALRGNAEAINKLPWDPAVKSLLDFTQVLTMMSEKLDWTVKLGDAFLADQAAVMAAVQRLRKKAYDEGNLKSGEQQNVSVQPASPTQPASETIIIQSAQPSVVYVPTYNPTVAYGPWPYPSYPPYYYDDPDYVVGTAIVSFGLGVACGAAWGHAWGDCDWDGGDVEIDIDNNFQFNQSIDRDQFKAEMNSRRTDGARQGRSTWQHDASHRQGVAYRDQSTSAKYRGSRTSESAVQAREAYRGRAEAARRDLSRGEASTYRSDSGRYSSGGGYRSGSEASRPGGATRSPTPDLRSGSLDRRTGSGGSRYGSYSQDYSGLRSSGFSGADSGSSARAASSRGQMSRSSGSYGGSRGGGGGSFSRGGGGGGGFGGASRGGGRR